MSLGIYFYMYIECAEEEEQEDKEGEEREIIEMNYKLPDESCRCMEQIGGEDSMIELLNITSLLYSAADV